MNPPWFWQVNWAIAYQGSFSHRFWVGRGHLQCTQEIESLSMHLLREKDQVTLPAETPKTLTWSMWDCWRRRKSWLPWRDWARRQRGGWRSQIKSLRGCTWTNSLRGWWRLWWISRERWDWKQFGTILVFHRFSKMYLCTLILWCCIYNTFITNL